MVEYQWTSDGEVEVCEEQKIVIEQTHQPIACYHCGKQLFTGEQAIKLTTEAQEEYILHEHCAKQSTKPTTKGR